MRAGLFFTALGGIVSVVTGWVASVLLDGFKTEHHPYTVKGQQKKYRDEGLPERHEGWYVVPGKIDRASYFLLGYFFVCVLILWAADSMV